MATVGVKGLKLGCFQSSSSTSAQWT